jgi:hypothetical protein
MNVFNRWLVRIGLGLVVVLLAIQLVPYGRDHRNPPVRSEPAWDLSITRDLARQACFDCHSNETTWPAYASIAPVSWLVQHDVNEGRAVLNFSEWPSSSKEAGEASQEVREGEMPPMLYQLLHADARLTAADREQLALGLDRTLGGSSVRAGRERERGHDRDRERE